MVSSESAACPEGQPATWRRMLISWMGVTSIGSGDAPTTRSLPSMPRPSQRRHGLGARRRGQDHLGAAKPGEHFRGVLGRAVDIAIGAELKREARLIRPAF